MEIWGQGVPRQAQTVALAWWNCGCHGKLNTWCQLRSTVHVGARLDHTFLDEEDEAELARTGRPRPPPI
eukprot:1383961-Rhodomonas_salina.1